MSESTYNQYRQYTYIPTDTSIHVGNGFKKTPVPRLARISALPIKVHRTCMSMPI